MTIIPAVDLLRGQCARLHQGDYEEATFYDRDPVSVAREFEQAGVKRIHIVDLDAAHGDKVTNRKQIRKIRKAVGCIIELGGGVRSDDDIEELLDLGIDRLVLGTTFARKPRILEGWSAHYGEVFVAGIDARDGVVYVSGWEQKTRVEDTELALQAAAVGASSIVYTNIDRDGTLSGPDIERTNLIAETSGLPVVLSGGIGSEKDVHTAVEGAHPGVRGIIVGKALYEGAVDLRSLVDKYQSEERADW
ncbi:MAG: 1-(5-phosphoribosyl)-5-[(5-phosphoribosylamino)methylideneamino]imidazole-4-carboxamide isomerase [Spirochaetaceae bacterium]